MKNIVVVILFVATLWLVSFYVTLQVTNERIRAKGPGPEMMPTRPETYLGQLLGDERSIGHSLERMQIAQDSATIGGWIGGGAGLVLGIGFCVIKDWGKKRGSAVRPAENGDGAAGG